MYDLAVDGLRDIKRFITLRRVARDPLSGTVDGSNVYFRTSYYPLFSSTTMTLWEGSTPISSGSFDVDYEAGMVTVDVAPSAQLHATYDLSTYSDTELKRILISAFDEMEMQLTRNYRLSSGSATYAEATEDSTNIYVIDGSTVTDPASGSRAFSTSRIQRGLFWACIEYVMSLRKADMAADGFMWREDRGITVDKSRTGPNRLAHLKFVEGRLNFYRLMAADEHYTQGEQYGEYQSSPATEDYLYNYEWQTGSKDEDYRGTLAGNV